MKNGTTITRSMRLALAALASNVRRRREALELTQEQAAERAGVGYRSWQRLEAGETNAGLDILVKVADALGVDPAELLVVKPPNDASSRRQAKRGRQVVG